MLPKFFRRDWQSIEGEHSLHKILEYGMAMALKPQDVLVVLKLLTVGSNSWSYACLAVELGMSPQVHSAIKRALAAQLAGRRDDLIAPHARNLEEFLVHGVNYAFAPVLGQITRGLPTGYAAPPCLSPCRLVGASGRLRGFIFSLPSWRLSVAAVRVTTFSVTI